MKIHKKKLVELAEKGRYNEVQMGRWVNVDWSRTHLQVPQSFARSTLFHSINYLFAQTRRPICLICVT